MVHISISPLRVVWVCSELPVRCTFHCSLCRAGFYSGSNEGGCDVDMMWELLVHTLLCSCESAAEHVDCSGIM